MVIFREQKKFTKDTGGKIFSELGKPLDAAVKKGFAVDIGTTTVVVTALDLEKKEILGTVSQTNEQTRLGADVMMRIMHCMSGRGETLHQLIVGQVEKMAGQFLEEGCQEERTAGQCFFFVVGNTVMSHLFLNKSTEGLAGYPFHPAYQGNYRCTGKEIGMERFREAEICVLSGIAAHVGGDALAVIGAEQLYGKEKIQLAVDLGTNAEIILNSRGNITACSTAAGPAFEGKGISCGMAAKGGAVSEVKIAAGNGNIILGVIEGGKAAGICSSGLLDLLAQLRGCGLLLTDGYLLRKAEAETAGITAELSRRLVTRNGQNAFLLCGEKEGTKEICLRQSDIRSLQLAKAAIQAGMISILEAAGLTHGEVDEFVVAGVLGSCMKQKSAIDIGLFPEAAGTCIRLAGNAAGKGAVLGVLDSAFAASMEKLAKEVSHIEIAQAKGFQERLMKAMDIQRWL
ncbi:DUF4445 domain-containing protein [bacterium D16-51]|nr:DUF4445 domain-containing protein [bacterium D16-59]RKI62068.1 DUF4445 domain-containing protein [bacterium D16-51]